MSDTQEDIDKVKKGRYTLNIFFLKSKIEDIQEDIIRLKSENRHIGDKVNSFCKTAMYNGKKSFEKVSEDCHYTYMKRVLRDDKTIHYLQKLQEANSKLIRKHRAKIRDLRTELSVYELLSRDV